MINKLSGWDDTIVALSTSPGIAAIAVIRLSGQLAFTIVNNLFPSKDLLIKPTHTLHVGLLEDGNNTLDEVVVALFKAPHSYTGENIIEISCHGSPFIQQQILDSCISNGARMARPGEFTQRAFLNGRLDLIQAEAVADLINSNTLASQKTALNNIRGGFSQRLKEIRERIIEFASLIELELDFAEEDVVFADLYKFYKLVEEIELTVKDLIASFQLGNVIKNGVHVAIIGKPNAGKSTLLNTLLNENRAIVSDIPGTTRDTIEEMLNINGILFRIIDTAGIRKESTDVIEQIGIEKSLEKMKSADVVIYIFDANIEAQADINMQVEEFDRMSVKYLLAGNKADVNDHDYYQSEYTDIKNIHFISAKNNTGVDDLKRELYDHSVQSGSSLDNTIITNARHLEALKKILESVIQIKTGLDEKRSGDLLSPDIRRCLYYLGEITGEITNEDKLDYIFSKFCIGK